MEKAAHLISLSDDKVKNLKKEYDVIYLGSEFCQNLIPTIEDMKKILSYKFKKVVFVFPFMNDSKIKMVKGMVSRFLKDFSCRIEISTSDIGLIYFLRKNYPRIILNISRPLSIEMVRTKPKELKKFMKDFKINAIETDEDFFMEDLKPSDIKLHYYMNYSFVATQRFCPFIKGISDVCDKICIGKKIYIRPLNSNGFMHLITNTYFTLKESFNEEKIKRYVSRIIFEIYT